MPENSAYIVFSPQMFLNPFRRQQVLNNKVNMIKGLDCHNGRQSLITYAGGICATLMQRFLFLTPNCTVHQNRQWHARHGRSILSRSLSPFVNHYLQLPFCLDQLIAQLIQDIKTLYENDTLDIVTLIEPLKKILQDFYQRKDVERINIFAILNSFRKKGCGFWYDSKYWTVCFSDRASLRLGKSNMTITFDSSIFFDMFRLIMNQLELVQQDLLSLMYMTILRDPNHRVLPRILNFELTIERNYPFWCRAIKWHTKRFEFLGNCKSAFICQRFFSKKDTNYYPKYTSLNSFRDFFRNSHILSHDEFKPKISGLSFEPI
jgi:hypothetical protein